MRCKACDRQLKEFDQFKRAVRDELSGKVLVVYEDLCKRCRDAVYKPEDTDEEEIIKVLTDGKA